MAKITFIEPDGTHRDIIANTGESLMQAATRNNVAGILAECGGSCMCGTCHCYVEKAWQSNLAPPESMEAETLEFVAKDIKPNSRLTCQIEASDAIDGLILRVAGAQIKRKVQTD